MSIICSLLLVSTTLALSSASPVPDNAGFMRQGVDMWPGDSYRQGQERVRRQQGQGRPLRKVQQGQGRPDRRPRPQQQERFYKPKQQQQQQQQQQRPLKPVKRQPAPVQKVFKQEPVAERVLQAYEAEQNTVEREDQARIQEQRRIQEREEQTRTQEQRRIQEREDQTRIQEQARIQEQRRIQEQMRKQEPVRNQEVYNEVERSYDTRPAPSQVYERSSSAQDSLESESFAAPAEQRDIEAAVAAGAAGYAGESYAEPQRLSFQIHGQGGPNAYKYGYDTGVGYNRQFKYEERDNNGVLHGRYGYYDQAGKLQVTHYTSDPVNGFHAEGEHVPKPEYR